MTPLPCGTYECLDRLWCIQRGLCKRSEEPNLPVPQERKSAMSEQQHMPIPGDPDGLVEWLRTAPSNEWCGSMLNKAADEIERLRKELAKEKAHRIWLEGGEVDD